MTTQTNHPPDVPVTQEDREAAADYGRATSAVSQGEAAAIRAGEWDDLPRVQWFARRRIAALSQSVGVAKSSVRQSLECLVSFAKQLDVYSFDASLVEGFRAAVEDAEGALSPAQHPEAVASGVVEQIAQAALAYDQDLIAGNLFQAAHTELVVNAALIERMVKELNWIAAFADIRSKDDSKTFARVNRGAMRTIRDRARDVYAEATEGKGR